MYSVKACRHCLYCVVEFDGACRDTIGARVVSCYDVGQSGAGFRFDEMEDDQESGLQGVPNYFVLTSSRNFYYEALSIPPLPSGWAPAAATGPAGGCKTRQTLR